MRAHGPSLPPSHSSGVSSPENQHGIWSAKSWARTTARFLASRGCPNAIELQNGPLLALGHPWLELARAGRAPLLSSLPLFVCVAGPPRRRAVHISSKALVSHAPVSPFLLPPTPVCHVFASSACHPAPFLRPPSLGRLLLHLSNSPLRGSFVLPLFSSSSLAIPSRFSVDPIFQQSVSPMTPDLNERGFFVAAIERRLTML